MTRRVLSGQVVGHEMNKTAMVRVSRVSRHPIYKKDVNVFKKYAAHDENNAYAKGAWVFIRETRPLSKTKRWEIVGLADGGLQ
ncbi:MAG: 30S ribosomal protein S17 [Alphaproteobacteria bacterium]|nr:30S ribosomal protein S17 [Alphaproteobacteria bacterium]